MGEIPLDGVMSPLTRELMQIFGAKGVDMTSWWAWTEPDWICSGCGRSKRELVRLNQKGQLMCRLVEHHDHMQDLLLKRFQEVSAAQDRVVADEFAERFAKRSAQMVSAYDNTIVCNDCNNADALGKASAGAHPDFSFSPGELRRFVIAKAGAPHSIDKNTAKAVWKEQEQTFQLRLRIIDRIARIAATNSHWFQPGDPAGSPRRVETSARRIVTLMGAHASVLDDLFGPKRSNRNTDATAWRHRKYPAAAKRPTPGDIDHVAKVVAPRLWSAVPDDWTCPGCGRAKAEIVRPSGGNAWSFPIASKYLRSSDMGKGTQHELCGDCGWTVERIRTEVEAVSCVSEGRKFMLMGLADITAIAIPQPHARHNFDNVKAEQLIARLAREIQRTDGRR